MSSLKQQYVAFLTAQLRSLAAMTGDADRLELIRQIWNARRLVTSISDAWMKWLQQPHIINHFTVEHLTHMRNEWVTVATMLAEFDLDVTKRYDDEPAHKSESLFVEPSDD